jgi:hypothetical protein
MNKINKAKVVRIYIAICVILLIPAAWLFGELVRNANAKYKVDSELSSLSKIEVISTKQDAISKVLKIEPTVTTSYDFDEEGNVTVNTITDENPYDNIVLVKQKEGHFVARYIGIKTDNPEKYSVGDTYYLQLRAVEPLSWDNAFADEIYLLTEEQLPTYPVTFFSTHKQPLLIILIIICGFEAINFLYFFL